MSRILLGTLGLTLIFWSTRQPSLADKKEDLKPAKWETVTLKSMTGKEEGVGVLRIWNSPAADAKWPQLALLRLSTGVYDELRKDPKELKSFVDGTKTGKPIFDAPVTITENCKLPEPSDQKVDGDVKWLVTMDHRTSRCSCNAILERAIEP